MLEVGSEDILKTQFDMSKAGYKVRIANLRDKGGPEVQEVRAKLRAAVLKRWSEIETGFLPKKGKYA